MIIYMIYYLVDCRLDPRNWDRKYAARHIPCELLATFGLFK